MFKKFNLKLKNFILSFFDVSDVKKEKTFFKKAQKFNLESSKIKFNAQKSKLKSRKEEENFKFSSKIFV